MNSKLERSLVLLSKNNVELCFTLFHGSQLILEIKWFTQMRIKITGSIFESTMQIKLNWVFDQPFGYRVLRTVKWDIRSTFMAQRNGKILYDVSTFVLFGI